MLGIQTSMKVGIACLLAALLSSGCTKPERLGPTGSPVAKHGQLRVVGKQLVDQRGRPVQLRGMSSFWLNHKGQFANEKSIAWLRKDWGISLFRAAIPVENPGGYANRPAAVRAKVDEIVQACVRHGLYVIIDYHTHAANQDPKTAERFFDEMSKTYGHLPNVIYEPWNEPEKVSWEADVRPYLQQIIQVIRKNDPENLILAGTPWWCLRVDEAAANPLGDKNTMYVLHFYAGSHWQEARDRADQALSKGLPLFVSEFGLSHADGGRNQDRRVHVEETDRWMQWMDQRGISWANWSLCDKDEAAAALKPGASVNGLWMDTDLSDSGAYIRARLRGEPSRARGSNLKQEVSE